MWQTLQHFTRQYHPFSKMSGTKLFSMKICHLIKIMSDGIQYKNCIWQCQIAVLGFPVNPQVCLDCKLIDSAKHYTLYRETLYGIHVKW